MCHSAGNLSQLSWPVEAQMGGEEVGEAKAKQNKKEKQRKKVVVVGCGVGVSVRT